MQCDHVPERILEIDLELRQRADRDFANQLAQEMLYDAAQQSVTTRAKVIDQHAQNEEEQHEEVEQGFTRDSDDPWAELHESPGAQANLDPDRFFSQYFLTDGKPNRRKTTRGLRLDGLAEDSDAIIHRAERYGLYKWMTKERPIRVCLGWDLQKVQEMAEFTDRKVRERRSQNRTREETRLKKIHDDLVARYQEEEKAKDKKKEGSQEWDLAGQYMIMASELLEYCSPEGPFTLTISDKIKHSDVGPGRRAGYDFDVASGSMFLATSSAIMDWLLADAEKEHQASLAGDAGLCTPRKRKEPPTEAQLHHRQKRDLQAPRAHQKKSMNYEIRIRGHEIVGDNTHIFHQPRSGHIRFKDDTFMVFSGKINMGESLGLIDVQGFKYSLEAPKRTPKWNAYTAMATMLEQEARERKARTEHEAVVVQSRKTKRTSSSEQFTTPKSSAKLPRTSSKKKKD